MTAPPAERRGAYLTEDVDHALASCAICGGPLADDDDTVHGNASTCAAHSDGGGVGCAFGRPRPGYRPRDRRDRGAS